MKKYLVIILCIVLSLSLMTSCKKKDTGVKNISYIYYSDNTAGEFKSQLDLIAQSDGYILTEFNSNESFASALSNVTAAINTKADYIIIDYPSADICKQIADEVIKSEIKYCIINQDIKGYICYYPNSDKIQDTVIDAVNKKIDSKIAKPNLSISLCSVNSLDVLQKQLVIDTNNKLTESFEIPSEFTSNDLVNEHSENVTEYVKGMLSTISKDKQILFICQNPSIALGARQAAIDLEISNNTTIVSFNHTDMFSDQMDNAWSVSIKHDYSNFKDMLSSRKPKSLSYKSTVISK